MSFKYLLIIEIRILFNDFEVDFQEHKQIDEKLLYFLLFRSFI